MRPIRITAFGGSLRRESVSAAALRACCRMALDAGAEVSLFTGQDLELPMYAPEAPARSPRAQRLLDALRTADGVLVASPTYHGGLSGLVKNVLDHTEDLAGETPCYLDGRPVGCLTVAWNDVAGAAALAGLRATVHALRGWAAPMGVVVPAGTPFGGEGACADPRTARRLEIVTGQVLQFAHMRRAAEREARAEAHTKEHAAHQARDLTSV